MKQHDHNSFTHSCPACGLAPRQVQPEATWGFEKHTKVALWNQVKALGIPWDSHETDLYIPVNDQTRALIDAYEFKCNVTQFTSQIDGKRWFDIPFAYLPAWEAKGRTGQAQP